MKNNKKGFTLVELVIVVAVMAILVAVAIPTVSSITTTATNATNDSNARTIESMIKLEVANTDAAKGTATTVSGTLIDTALTKAKLGISGKFVYDSITGKVAYDKSADAAQIATTSYVIVLDDTKTAEADIVVVTQGKKE